MSAEESAAQTPWLGCLKDGRFWLAMSFGPVAWIGLGDITTPSWPVALVFFKVVVLYPLLEEFAFRGTVQTWILSRTARLDSVFGLSLANVVTSLLFAAAHLIYQPVFWALATFLPSLVFGYFRERFDRVLPGVVLHSWYNLGFLLFVAGQT